jgi:hypothetical protein
MSLAVQNKDLQALGHDAPFKSKLAKWSLAAVDNFVNAPGSNYHFPGLQRVYQAILLKEQEGRSGEAVPEHSTPDSGKPFDAVTVGDEGTEESNAEVSFYSLTTYKLVYT